MKNKMTFLYVGIAVLLLITGFVVYKAVFSGSPAPVTQDASPTPVAEPSVDSSVSVTLTKSPKPYTVVLNVAGLSGKYTTVGYEFSYESKGLIKGVNSGSKPLDVAGKTEFSREVYMGTCSKNDCTPDVGVTKVTVALEFTDTTGARSQFSKDYDL
jgi:hypothetical protein